MLTMNRRNFATNSACAECSTLFIERSLMVRAAGLEPALLAKTDFESVASTIPPRPHSLHFLVATAERSEVSGPILD
jgi:hypothetical protein